MVSLGLHSLAGTSGAALWLQCACFSLRCLLVRWSTGSRCSGFQHLWHGGSIASVPRLQSNSLIVVEHGLVARGAWASCSAACGIFPEQVSNPQADSLSLSHQGSPLNFFIIKTIFSKIPWIYLLTYTWFLHFQLFWKTHCLHFSPFHNCSTIWPPSPTLYWKQS